MECDPADLLAEEYRMISALQPEQNKLGRKPSNVPSDRLAEDKGE
jgi:hypothetical protein